MPNVKRPVRRFKRIVRRSLRRALIAYVRTGRPRPGNDEKVTILLISAWGMGGTIRAAHNLAGYLVEQGREVEILSFIRRRDEPFFGAFPAGLQVTALDDQRPAHRPRGPMGLAYRLLTRLPSMLMDSSDRSFPLTSLWADVQLVRELRGRRGFLIGTRPGLNFIVAMLRPPGTTTLGQEQMHLLHHNKALRKRMPGLYPKLDAFVVLTEGHKVQYDELLRGKGHVVPIPNTVSDHMPGPPADLSRKVVFTAGRSVYQKGFDLLVRAWAPIAADHPDWTLRICGGAGDLKPKVAALIDELDLHDSVSFEGPSRVIGEDMAAASVFALSSRFEGFPLILLEAMSKEMAVVAFDCPTGPGEIVEDRVNGLLVPPKDADAFSAALREMIEDEELRRRCAPVAGRTAQSYTMRAIGPRWEALLGELSARRRGGVPAGAPAPRYAADGGEDGASSAVAVTDAAAGSR